MRVELWRLALRTPAGACSLVPRLAAARVAGFMGAAGCEGAPGASGAERGRAAGAAWRLNWDAGGCFDACNMRMNESSLPLGAATRVLSCCQSHSGLLSSRLCLHRTDIVCPTTAHAARAWWPSPSPPQPLPAPLPPPQQLPAPLAGPGPASERLRLRSSGSSSKPSSGGSAAAATGGGEPCPSRPRPRRRPRWPPTACLVSEEAGA